MSETQREDGEHKPLVCGGYLWHDSPLERRASAASHTSTYLSCQCCHEHSCLFCEMKHVMNDSNYPVSMTASASGSARYHSSPILLRTPPQKRFLQNPSEHHIQSCLSARHAARRQLAFKVCSAFRGRSNAIAQQQNTECQSTKRQYKSNAERLRMTPNFRPASCPMIKQSKRTTLPKTDPGNRINGLFVNVKY